MKVTTGILITFLITTVVWEVRAQSVERMTTSEKGEMFTSPAGNFGVTTRASSNSGQVSNPEDYAVKVSRTRGSGTSTYILNKKIKKVNEDNSLLPMKVTIFPNPASSSVQINCHIEDGQHGTLIIRNLLGDIVEKHYLSSGAVKQQILLHNYSNSVYLLSVMVDGEVGFIGKLAVVK